MKKKILFIVLAIILVIAIVASILIYLNGNYIQIRYVGSSFGPAVVGWTPKEIILSINRSGNYEYIDNNNSSSIENYTIEHGNIDKEKLNELEEMIMNIISSSAPIDIIVPVISEIYSLKYGSEEYEIPSETFYDIINAVK